MTPGPAEPAKAILIYAPGLVRDPTNTAPGVADVIAGTLDRRRPGNYRSETSLGTAPRGLRLGRTIFDPTGHPVLEVFELDYRDRFANLDSADRPAGPPGPLHAVCYSVWSVVLLMGAWKRQAKGPLAKWQLWAGLVVALVLAALAATTVIAALAAMGLLSWLPPWLKQSAPSSPVNAPTVAVAGGAGVAAFWAKTRSQMLQMAEQARHILRYFGEERYRKTITNTLPDAIDGLLDGGWTAPIHVLGYSFGSLVVLDALFARSTEPNPDRLSKAIQSLTTIGCPGDAVRLYFPTHFADRKPPPSKVGWTNVYIPADIFASNFCDGNDFDTEVNSSVTAAAKGPRHRRTSPVDSDRPGRRRRPVSLDPRVGGIRPTCVRYTEEKLSPLTLVRMKGLRTHSGYWDSSRDASCFDLLIDTWLPIDGPELPTAR